MSNTQVGNVYQQIISDVVDSSRVDFEEGGVDEHVLEELRLGWQQKLSQLQVATFPWDPKPEPTPQIANPPTVPSNAGNYQPMSTPPIQQPQSGLTMPQVNNNGNAPRIKTEPGLDNSANNGAAPQQNYQMPPSLSSATTAQQRAAAHLHQNYGPRAAASINAIQSGGQHPQPQNGQSVMPTMEQMQRMRAHMQAQQQQQAQAQHQAQAQGLTMPQAQGMHGRPQPTAEQYRNQMAAQAQRQMQATANGQNGVGGAQTDGAGDDVESLSVIKRFDADGQEISMGRIEIDGMIRQKIEAMGTSMEGGGLMLPLHKASTPSKRSRKVKRTAQGMAQADGGDDEDDDDKDGIKDEELDEDAINSDLDDPDDGLNEEEDEDEGMGHIMLCMYDKVQRVKNKWKCVMKDGVLTVNGKEYVFHKASGEYEW
ncbi:hypothetical protein EG329_004031 [Mollisiaceae sp. DMI_Dod_QoI]|nr:hypothetical protein EG329_004031 [Helotiales sp. DMI_Dod_QoI]